MSFWKGHLKVLPLECWMRCPLLFKGMDLKEINPIFYRDGYYMESDFYCWFEHNGKAWRYSDGTFLHDLYVYNIKPMRNIELDALKVLVKNRIGGKFLRDALHDQEFLRDLKHIERSSALRMMRCIKCTDLL